MCHPHAFESISPSSGFQPASPLKGEAVRYVKLAQVTASPLRGEAARRADEGGIDTKALGWQRQKINIKVISTILNFI